MYKLLLWTLSIVLVFVLLASCSPAEPTSTATARYRTVNTQIPALADEELTEAIRRAQETLPNWRREFLAPRKAYSMASLKVRFAGHDGAVEDMWTEPLFILDDVYTVRMVEGVTLEKGIHPDRILDVKPEDIVDWMLLEEDGTVVGGYTLRLEYERMDPEQQKRYLQITGYKFE
jgi:uncharacterized protein YegJ (DUF2314 family)